MARRTRFSFSRVTTFEQCPRRYRYRYIDGVHEGFVSIEAFMGRQAHSTVEWMYEERRAGREPTLDESVARYCGFWDGALATERAPVKVVRSGETREDYRRLGAEMVSDYYRRNFAADALETIAMERHFTIELGGRHAFQGYIDRLARDGDGRVVVIDFKTGKRVPQRFEGKDADQLRAYALALFADGEGELELRLEYLRTGKRVAERIRADQAGPIEERLAARIDAAEAATVYPPVPGPLCGWCGFNDVCEAATSAAPPRRRGRAREGARPWSA